MDGDGDLDVVAGNIVVANKLYLNDGASAPFDTVGAGTAIERVREVYRRDVWIDPLEPRGGGHQSVA